MAGYIATSKSNTWTTPKWLFGLLDWIFNFTCDVASSDVNCLVANHITEAQDALSLPWLGRCYCNPPYNNLGKWIEKAFKEVKAGNTELVCLLIPSRTDTKAWHEYIFGQPGVTVHFVAGRLKFGDETTPAPFPSAIIIMHK